MRKANRILGLICAMLAGISCVMCAWAVISNIRIGKLEALIEELESRPAAEIQAQSAHDPNTPAAEFNGGIVTVAEASAEYELLRPYYEMLGMNEAEYAEDAKLDVLDSLVERKILENKAREAGIYELDAAALAQLEAEVRAAYDANVEYYMAFRFDENKSDAEVRSETIEYLNETGYSYEGLLEQAKAEAWRDRLFDHVTAGLEVEEAELRRFYEEQLQNAQAAYSSSYAEYESDCAAGKDVLWHPEGVRRVQMLLVPFDFDQYMRYSDIQAMLAAGDASRLNELDALYAELEEAGMEMLARIRGGEDLFARIGEEGYSNPEGEYISEQSTIFGDEVRKAAMALEKIGDVSDPVRCDEGLCILRYAADVPAGPVAFEEMSEEFRANYVDELRRSRYNAAVMRWIDEAEAVYYPERF